MEMTKCETTVRVKINVDKNNRLFHEPNDHVDYIVENVFSTLGTVNVNDCAAILKLMPEYDNFIAFQVIMTYKTYSFPGFELINDNVYRSEYIDIPH